MSADLQNVAQIADPKASQGVFDLPCGHLDADGKLHTEIALRELTGAEEDLLASKQASPFKKYNDLLVRCTLRIGSITDRGLIAEAVKRLPIGDRLFILLAIRRISIGDDYTFEEACPECKTARNYTVQLSELEIKKMPNPLQRLYDMTLPSGVAVRYRVSTGEDEERSMKQDKSEDVLSKGILMRLELIGGVPPDLNTVKSMKWKDRLALRAGWNKVEGGVDTEAEMTCTSCNHEFKKDIEVTPSFFFPSETSTT